MITNIEDYFSKGCGRCARFDTADCSTQQWASGLADLRRICRASILTETVKWGHPCYTHKDCNIAIIGAFRNDFRLTFFNAALMKDPKHILQKQGPNTKHASMICFTSNAAVALLEPTILSYLKESKAYAETGQKPPKEKSELELPEELIDTLNADPALAEAFYNLTPGRQKSYVINLKGAKKSETRTARMFAFREKIIAGKGALDR